MNVYPLISHGLDDAGCQMVVEGALRLLDEVGIECRSVAGRDLMCSHPGMRAQGERVHFDRDFLTEHLARLCNAAKAEPPPAPTGFTLGPPWTSLNIADVRSGRIRPADESDLARAVRLYEAMGIRKGLPPVVVGTAPAEFRDLLSTRICLEHSESFAGPTEMPPAELLQPFIDMLAVVGRKPRIHALFVISPMRFDAGLVDFCLQHRDDSRFDLNYVVSGMPCAGATAPLAFPAAFCQTVAEGLAGSVFAWLCSGERKGLGLRVDPFDFRFANYLVGAPECMLCEMVSRRIHHYLFGRPRRGTSLLSMAKWPDAQAVHDHTMSACLGALQGSTFFGNSGQLSHDEVFSPEIVVIDRDIVASVERFVRGLEWRDGRAGVDEAVAIVAEGVSSGCQFMDHPTTLAGFRSFVSSGRLFKGMNLGQWQQAGARSLIEEAAAEVDALVASNTFQRPAEQVRELEAIYRSATTPRRV